MAKILGVNQHHYPENEPSYHEAYLFLPWKELCVQVNKPQDSNVSIRGDLPKGLEHFAESIFEAYKIHRNRIPQSRLIELSKQLSHIPGQGALSLIQLRESYPDLASLFKEMLTSNKPLPYSRIK